MRSIAPGPHAENYGHPTKFVMPGLTRHPRLTFSFSSRASFARSRKGVDGRVKPGHDAFKK
jgi:hypothetical protein